MNKYLERLLIMSFAFVVAWGVVSLRRSIAGNWKQPRAEIKTEVSAEASIPIPTSENFDKLRSLSPYDIEVFIDAHPNAKLAELWQRLGIQQLNVAANWQSETRPEHFLAECSNCGAETFEYDLDDEPGSEVLVRIEDRPSESCRYLIFKHSMSSSWKLLGHIDHDFGRYRMPQHMIVISHGRPWLVIQEQGQSGSGVALYFDRLFLVGRNSLKEVMRYTSEGHQLSSSDAPDRDFSGRIIDCRLRDGVATVEIEFAVTYYKAGDSQQDAFLFTKVQRAVFDGEPGHKVLGLNRTRSALSQNEIDAVFDVDSLTNQDFLKYNFAELSQLATAKDWNRRRWLGQFLRGFDRTPERRRLQLLLGHG